MKERRVDLVEPEIFEIPTTELPPCILAPGEEYADGPEIDLVLDLEGNPLSQHSASINTDDWCSNYFSTVTHPHFGPEICTLLFTLFVITSVVIVMLIFACHIIFRDEYICTNDVYRDFIRLASHIGKRKLTDNRIKALQSREKHLDPEVLGRIVQWNKEVVTKRRLQDIKLRTKRMKSQNRMNYSFE